MITVRLLIATVAETSALSADERAALLGDDIIVDLRANKSSLAEMQITNAEAFILHDLCPVDSLREKDAFVRASEAMAHVSQEIDTLSVNGVRIGASIAAGMFSAIRQEGLYMGALGELVRRDPNKRVTIISAQSYPALEAAICRLTHSGDIEVDQVVTLINGSLSEKEAVVSLEELQNNPANTEIEPLDLKLDLPKIVSDLDDDELPLVVIDTATASNSIQIRHTFSVLNALDRRGEPYRIMSLMPFPQHAKEVIESQELQHARLIDFQEFDLRAFRNSVLQARAHFARALAAPSLKPVATTPLTPHVMNKKGLVFGIFCKFAQNHLKMQAALQLPTKSVWIGISIGSICNSVVENAGDIPVFSGQAASISHHIRNLPFIEPRLQTLSYGTMVADIYRKRGLDPEGRVHSVGPLFYNPGSQCDRQTSNGQLTIVVMTSRMDPDAEDAWLVPLAEWAVANGHLFKISLHPSRPGAYDAILRKKSNVADKVVYSRDETAEERISSADLMISDVSTSALITASHQVPLIQVETSSNLFQYNDLSEFGVSVKTRNADDTIAASKAILTNLTAGVAWHENLTQADYNAFDAAYCHRGDKSAADAIAKILHDPTPPPEVTIDGASLILQNINDGVPA